MTQISEIELLTDQLKLPAGFSPDSPPETVKLWRHSLDKLTAEAIASGAIITTADQMMIERLAYTYAYMRSREWSEQTYTAHELKTLNGSFLELAREFLKLIGRDDDERQAHQRKLFVEAVYAAVNEAGLENEGRIRVLRGLRDRFEI